VSQQSVLQPIRGLSAERLRAIIRHLKLNCKGPTTHEIFGTRYLGWACSGPIAMDAPTSLVILDIMGIDRDQILSVSGELHASPNTSNFPQICRRVIGYLLAASDPLIAEQARGWLDHALNNQAVGELEVEGVVFEFILHHDRALTFDIHAAGF
jgi:hypothetical protein